MPKGQTLTFRLSADRRERLERAAKHGPYSLTMTAIIDRGIDLAIAELEQMAAAGTKAEAR